MHCAPAPAAPIDTCRAFADAVEFIRGLSGEARAELLAALPKASREQRRLFLRALNFVGDSAEEAPALRRAAFASCLPEMPA